MVSAKKIRAIPEMVLGRLFKSLGWPRCEQQLQRGDLHLSHIMRISAY